MSATPPQKSQASSLPMAKPEDVGFSSERLQRIHAAMQRHIDAGEIAGVTTLVAHNGKIVYFDPQGWADLATKKPMIKDNVFNWASATKPMIATAVMMMVEEGKINLSDPVWKYLPDFKNMQVRQLKPNATLEIGGAAGQDPTTSKELLKANRDITIHDLMTHTSGLMSVGVVNPAAPDSNDLLKTDLAGMMPRFAKVPLDFQPGTKWAYSNWAGFDMLGRIVELTSGKPLDQFLKERLFEPLGIKDTGFDPFDDYRAPRLATRYNPSPTGLKKVDPPTPWSIAKTYFSGAAGLSGTTEDYFRFMQMLANGGEFNGKRILSPASVELMRSNHVGDLFPGSQGFPKAGTGFGYGVQVVVDHNASDSLLPDGTFGWVGASGCEGLASPKENIVLIFMVGGGNNGSARVDFHTTAMQAFVQ
jgi:CubicO group peptidase (beta-lactamase class C family)